VSAVADRLAELGLTLPPPPKALAVYQPAVLVDEWVYTAGQLPLREGELIAEGLVGSDLNVDEAADCARQCALNALAAIAAVTGDLDAVQRVVKVVGYVASAPGFTAQPAVLNGASELLGAALGDAGQHARSAVGVASLPMNAPVEIDLVARVRASGSG
jgi:enamine deaminase RidA (YjgF/YER057c/UK114 family)